MINFITGRVRKMKCNESFLRFADKCLTYLAVLSPPPTHTTTLTVSSKIITNLR